ncbi:PLP-dependent aminotransferase family protein [Companilactobacillus insicii]|uniref:MocR-like pyridoxine biosynthesis transcription factor PdxR n=1 Tax=Companilactobacillus insicii TaxID=1732567 RepID=UPI000F76F7CB|nr:PLP-dependent aminotransferase family protein [Companilactobacillus insicii]
MKKINAEQILWRPNKKSSVPLYQQIFQFVCNNVSRGQWPVGTKLPSQRSLSKLFEVNRSTITTAIEELTSYGIISGKSGAGTEVISNTWSLFLPTTTDWNKFIATGFFHENNNIIQEINRLEFEPDLIRLGTGEIDPSLFPQEMWQKVLNRLGTKVMSLGYLEPLGLLELREALADHLNAEGLNVDADNILITSGSLQALQLISAALLQRGSTVYTEAPSYLKSLQLFQSMGMELSGIPMDNEGIQYWKLPRVTNKFNNILYTIPTNQNPTGITMSMERRRSLLDFCIENRLPIIEDGAYQELCYDDGQPKTLKSWDKNDMVIYLGTASKTLAPGLRIGWIVASKPIVQRLGDVKMQMDYGASSVSQWVLTEFMNSGLYDEYLEELIRKLRNRRDRAVRSLSKYMSDIATWNVPTGGFYIWLTFKSKIKIEQFFEQAVKEKVLLNPGDIYDFKHSRSLRLSFAYITEDEFERSIKKLRRIYDK